MAKLNTNGNAYTIIYAAVIVVIVAFLLAFVASALKPTQDDNVANDKRSQILAALRIEKGSDYNVQEKFAELVKADPVFGENASEKQEEGGFNVYLRGDGRRNRCRWRDAQRTTLPASGQP